MTIGLRAAINAKCRDCIFDEKAPGNWKKQVSRCSVYKCPLWPVRPKTSAWDVPDQPAAHLAWLVSLELREQDEVAA